MREDLRATFVTRQYMVSQNYELYYYKDLKMQTVGSHTHDYFEFYFFVGGNITMYINRKRFELSSGDLVIIPPGISHYAVVNDPNQYYERFVFWITTNYYKELLRLSTDYGYILEQIQTNNFCLFHYDSVQFNTIQAKILSVIQESRQKRFGNESKIRLGISDLLLEINRISYEEDHPLNNSKRVSLTQKVINYIDNHITEDLNLDNLADYFYISKYYLAHTFKENVGLSIHQYIIKKRLYLFRDYIRQNESIGDAYLMFGFSDYSTMFRGFKKEFGMSPNDYKSFIEKEQKLSPDEAKQYA